MNRQRVALIGLGAVANRIHLPALRRVPALELVAACDLDSDRREKMRAQFKIPRVYEDARTMIENERPDCVIIGTPPALHTEHCLLALEHGAHVFCEKPFVERDEQGRAVIATARRAERHVAVNHQYRYMPIYAEPARRLASDEFGKLYLAQVWQQVLYPPTMETNWRARLKEYLLFEFGTHVLDLLICFFGALPESVTALMPRVRADIPADALDLVQLRFPGERAATINLNRLSHAPDRYLEMRLDCERASLRISFGAVAYARLGWLRALRIPTFAAALARGGEARAEWNGRSQRLALEWRAGLAPATARHLAEFVCDIEANREPTSSAEHALDLLKIVRAGYDSARSGETIRLAWDR